MRLILKAIFAGVLHWLLVEGSNKFALVTLVCTPEYSEMSNVMLFSFKKHMENTAIFHLIDYVAFLIQDYTDNNLITKNLVGWDIRYVPHLEPSLHITNPRFNEQFAKLHVFNMTEYKRVLILDSDTLVLILLFLR